MTLSAIIVLCLLGSRSLNRYRKAKSSGDPLPRRSYLYFFPLCGILLLHGMAAVLCWYPQIEEFLLLEILFCIFLLPAYGILWWFVHSVRDGWLFRGVLLVLIFFFAAGIGWRILRSHRQTEESDRALVNLHRCAVLLKEGKRRELRRFIHSAPDTSFREWNEAFERTFPAEGEKQWQ